MRAEVHVDTCLEQRDRVRLLQRLDAELHEARQAAQARRVLLHLRLHGLPQHTKHTFTCSYTQYSQSHTALHSEHVHCGRAQVDERHKYRNKRRLWAPAARRRVASGVRRRAARAARSALVAAPRTEHSATADAGDSSPADTHAVRLEMCFLCAISNINH